MNVLTLGEKIRKRRKALGMTLKEVALDKVTPGQISLVESGKSNPSIDLLNYLSDKLDISLDYLMESEYSQVNKIATFYSYIIKSSLMFKEFDRAEEYITKLSKLVSEYNFNNQRLRLYYFEGLLNYHKANDEKALELLIKASMSDNIFNYKESIEIYELIGVIFLKKKLYRSALSYFLALEIISDKIEVDKSEVAACHFFIAKCYEGLNIFNKMKEYITKSYFEFEKYLDKENEIRNYLKIAIKSEENQEEQKAYAYAEHLYRISNNFESLRFKNDSFKELSDLTLKNNMDLEALNLNRVIFAKNIEKKDKNIVLSLCDFVETFINNGNISLAEKLLDVAEEPYFVKSNEEKIRIYELKASINLLLNNRSQAENNLILAFNIAKNKDYEKKLKELSMRMAIFYEEEEDIEEAKKYLSLYMKKNDKTFFTKE